jgi:hypothetical protein
VKLLRGEPGAALVELPVIPNIARLGCTRILRRWPSTCRPMFGCHTRWGWRGDWPFGHS